MLRKDPVSDSKLSEKLVLDLLRPCACFILFRALVVLLAFSSTNLR